MFIFVATVVIAQVVSLPTDIYLSRMRRAAMKKVSDRAGLIPTDFGSGVELETFVLATSG